MNFKNGLVLLMVGLLYSVSPASISENFAKAGILIDGSGSFDAMDVNNGAQYYFSGSGRIGLFLIDGLLPNIRLGYHYYSSNFYSHEPFLSVGANWYFGYPRNENATKGIAHALGLSVASYVGLKGGERPVYDLELLPQYTFYLFLAERVAPYINIEPSFSMYKSKYIKDEWNIGIYVNFGFAYFLPTKSQVLIKK